MLEKLLKLIRTTEFFAKNDCSCALELLTKSIIDFEDKIKNNKYERDEVYPNYKMLRGQLDMLKMFLVNQSYEISCAFIDLTDYLFVIQDAYVFSRILANQYEVEI